MSFEPVELVNPSTGREHCARTAVDLNDRLNAGYQRVEKKSVAPSPVPRVSDYDSGDFSYDAVEYRDGE